MVESEYYYAHNVSQTSGQYGKHWNGDAKKYRVFNDLANIKASSGVAKTSQIGGKNGTYPKPSIITAKNFQCNIPNNADISKVTVEYAHEKINIGGASPNIKAPTISLLGVSGQKKTGTAPTTTMTNRSVSFSFKPTPSQVNSTNFGVKIEYPENTNTNPGYLSLKYIRVKITYKVPKYALSIKPTSSAKKYVNSTMDLELTVNNSNKTEYDPTLTVTLPSGVSFNSKVSGDGTVTGSGNKITWKPSLSSSISRRTVKFRVNLTTTGQNKTFYFNANTGASQVSCTITVFAVEVTQATDSKPSNNKGIQVGLNVNSINSVKKGEPFDIILEASSTAKTDLPHTVEILLGTDTTGIVENVQINPNYDGTFESFENRYLWHLDFTEGKSNVSTITITGNSEEDDVSDIKITTTLNSEDPYDKTVILIPTHFNKLFCMGYQLNENEKSRLGKPKQDSDPFTYVCTTKLKVIGTDTLNDYGQNYRVGVFTGFAGGLIQDSCITTEYDNYWNLQNVEREHKEGGVIYSSYTGGNLDLINSSESNPYYWLPLRGELTFELDGFEGVGSLKFGTSTNLISINLSELECQALGEAIYESVFTDTLKLKWENGFVTAYYNQKELNLNDGEIDDGNTHSFEIGVPSQNGYRFFISLDNNSSIAFHDFRLKTLDFTEEDIVPYVQHWSEYIPSTNLGSWTDAKCEFDYNNEDDVIVVVTGEYIEAIPVGDEDVTVCFTNPTIVEEDNFKDFENVGVYPTPLGNLFSDIQTSEINLPYDAGNTYPIRIYNFEKSIYEDNENYVIQGISISASLENSSKVNVICSLISPFGQRGSRSIVLNDSSTEISFGGQYDLWGFDFEDLKDLDDWEFEFFTENPYGDDKLLVVNNVQVTLHYLPIQNAKVKCYVENEDTRFYGMIITKVDIPTALKTDTRYLEITGKDSNDAYRMNIDKKEITIEFRVEGCSIKETTSLLKRIGKLFTNQRNEVNKPLVKKIEFSHYPGEYWDFVMEDPIDAEAKFVDYEGKIKLIIPAGTSYSLEQVSTGSVGSNTSLAKVNPIINLVPNSIPANIPIILSLGAEPLDGEDDNRPKMIIRHSSAFEKDRDLIVIDCQNREVTLHSIVSEDAGDTEEELETMTVTDITSAVDFNSTWFIIHGEYEFHCSNASVQTVNFKERW